MTLIDLIQRFEQAIDHMDTMVGMPDLNAQAARLKAAHDELHDALLSCPDSESTHGEAHLPAGELNVGVFHNGVLYAAGHGAKGEPAVIRLTGFIDVFAFDDAMLDRRIRESVSKHWHAHGGDC